MEFCVKLLSFPSWERGLKYKYPESHYTGGMRRSPRGSVD